MLMEDFESNIQTANINDKWLLNIYENIKNLEDYERLVRDGCKKLLDYLQIPARDRPVVVADTQYKNLQLFVTEFKLLLADLTPVLNPESAKVFDDALDKIDNAVKTRSLFVKDTRDTNNKVIEVRTTEFFWKTINILHKTKVDLFKQIKNILYINTETN